MSSPPDDISALTDEQRFGKGLAKARKLAGWNQTEAAERCGVTRPTISAWENGSVVEQTRLLIDLVRQGPEPRDAILKGMGAQLPTTGLDLDRNTELLINRILQARASGKWFTIASAIDLILRGMTEENAAPIPKAAEPREKYGGAR